MRRLDVLAALVAVVALAFLACSPDPLDGAVPQSGGTTPTAVDSRELAGSNPARVGAARRADDGQSEGGGRPPGAPTSTTEPEPVVPATAAPPVPMEPTTTTVPPTTAPPPTVASAGSCGGWRDLVAAHFANVSAACSVLMCESEGNPSAVGAAGERGLLQIHPVHRPTIRAAGLSWGSMFDPASNLAFGARLHAGQGWGPWTCQP